MTATKANIVYVPILKSKGGELWALSNLQDESRGRIRPLIELHGHKTKAPDDHLQKLCIQLAEAWGHARFYMDGVWLHHDAGSASVLERMFSYARDAELRAMPVVRPAFSGSSLSRVREIVETDGRGYLIRAKPDQVLDESLIENIVERLGQPYEKVDFLLDYGARPMNLGEHVPLIPHVNRWRRFIAASGVFPKSVAGFGLGEWQAVPRLDWTSWRAGVAFGLSRNPLFGDYVTRAPGAPAGGGNPPVHLRYASGDVWATRVDGRHQDGDAVEMHAICQSLMDQPFFSGEMFSAGDMEIVRTANPTEGPGGPKQWLQWCLSHHLELVVDELTGVAV